MGSNYYNYGNERGSTGLSSSSSSSSKKGKKGNSDKPKQPQRGLGVAQLEKIRLHSQLGSNYLPSLHNPNYPPSFTQEDMGTTYSSSSSSFYSSSSSPTYGYQGPHGVVMGLPDHIDRTTIRYGDNQSSSIARWNHGNAAMGTQHFSDPIMTRPFFEPIAEGSIKNHNYKHGNYSMGSSNQIPDSSSSEEIDLELRLSR